MDGKKCDKNLFVIFHIMMNVIYRIKPDHWKLTFSALFYCLTSAV